ncbi:hypothetical protein J1605_013064 [Eschrichtius robustus]|uniref:[2Fe-2S]-binding domain-containing protein n=1 Tax=Eschrichtius robustus TaxID=9764 RepID=A0AB34GK08_ESCRO|nr:hypothetical protein J1605_013064 [Eschrichtius robustus]
MWTLAGGGGSRKAGPVTMPVSFQERIAKSHGTRCRICTPGMVMPMYTLLKSHPQPSEEQLLAALGVRSDLNKPTARQSQVGSCINLLLPTHNATPAPFRDPSAVSEESKGCQQKGTGKCCLDQGENDSSSLDRKSDVSPFICMELFAEEEFQPLDPTQELIFPPRTLGGQHAGGEEGVDSGYILEEEPTRFPDECDVGERSPTPPAVDRYRAAAC